MGCSLSSMPSPQTEWLEELKIEHPTEEKKELIKESWKIIQQDANKTGIIIFVRLFESHPECKDAFFNFRDVSDMELQTSKQLRAHGLRVMSFIEKSVARLWKQERLEQMAIELGRKHYYYRSDPKYYMPLGTEFIKVIKPILKERWSSEMAEAWKTLFIYLTRLMRLGFEDEERKQRLAVAEPRKHRL